MKGRSFFGYQHQTISWFDVVLVMKWCLVRLTMIIRHKIWYIHIHITWKLICYRYNSLIFRSRIVYRIPNLAAAQITVPQILYKHLCPSSHSHNCQRQCCVTARVWWSPRRHCLGLIWMLAASQRDHNDLLGSGALWQLVVPCLGPRAPLSSRSWTRNLLVPDTTLLWGSWYSWHCYYVESSVGNCCFNPESPQN